MPRKGLSKPKFEALFKSGKRVSTANFRIVADQGEGRLGISSSKKIGCHARRNWVKRRIRESIFRLESHLKPDLDYILIAHSSVVDREFDEMLEELKNGIARMNERWVENSESS